jgi:hypothetical protein
MERRGVTVDNDRGVARQTRHLSRAEEDFRPYLGALRHLPKVRHSPTDWPAKRGLSQKAV